MTTTEWDARPRFALDADLTVYWPAVRPCWEDATRPWPTASPAHRPPPPVAGVHLT